MILVAGPVVQEKRLASTARPGRGKGEGRREWGERKGEVRGGVRLFGVAKGVPKDSHGTFGVARVVPKDSCRSFWVAFRFTKRSA